MDAPPAPDASDPGLDEARERSLRDDLNSLAAEARTLAEAELAYHKARAAYAGQEAPRIALLGLLAAVFVFVALMALVLGLLALTPVLGAWGATGAVTGGLLLLALVLAGAAMLRVKALSRTLGDGGAG